LGAFEKVSPGELSPVGESAGQYPVFSWGVLPGASGYLLEVFNASNVTVVNVSLVGGANVSFGVVSPLAFGEYTWRVRGLRGVNVSQFAVAGVRIVPLPLDEARPEVVAPVSGSVVHRWPVFEWRPLAVGVNYTLRVFNASNVSVLERTTSATSYAPVFNESLRDGGVYAWSLVAVNGSVSSLPALVTNVSVVAFCAVDGVCVENESNRTCPEDCGANNLTLGFDLVTGVNAISVPLVPSPQSDTWEEVFGGERSKLDRMYAYDGGWLVFHGDAGVPGSLSSVSPLTGYVIFMDAPARILVSGNVSAGGLPSRPLKAGWNLVGKHGFATATVSGVFGSLAPKSVWLYDRAGGGIAPVLLNASALDRRAYFIDVPSDAMLSGGSP
jgi:hypothetical protein